MSLSLSLSNALSGLNVNQRTLQVISNNISNSNNPDYSRKVIDQSAQVVAGQGAGVKVEDIDRTIDQFLVKSLQKQSSTMGKAQTLDRYSELLQGFMGRPGAENSIDSYLTSYVNAWQQLAETPERGSFRLNVVNAGNTLALNVRELATEVNRLRFEADTEIKQSASFMNNKLSELHSVNLSLANAFALGSSQAELLDQRDALIRDISEQVDLTIFTRDDGRVNLYAANDVALLDDSLHQVEYRSTASVSAFISDVPLGAMTVYRLDNLGDRTGDSRVLVTSGTSDTITTNLTSGRVAALVELRDEKLPAVLDQLDMLASRIRDEVNALHNAGSSFPGANSLTGTREVSPAENYGWSGDVRIGLVDVNGRPVPSPWQGESGLLPLTMDMSTLDSGFGSGQPTMQTIVDEINAHYGVPQNKVSVGALNNIRLASDSTTIPGTPPQFSFDLDLENISGADVDFFVTDITILDDSDADITSVTTNVPQVSLAGTGTFTTTSGEETVTVTTAAAHGFAEGDIVFLSDPGMAINGIPASEINGYVTISSVSSSNSFTFEVASTANMSGSVDVASQTATPVYHEIETGQIERTRDSGAMTVDLSGNTASEFYTVQVQVGVYNGVGGVETATVSYRINNNGNQLLNQRYSARSVSGNGTITPPSQSQALMRAKLVNESGVELPRIDGKYVTTQSGFLQLEAANDSFYVTIDSLDSQQLGYPNQVPAVAGTDRGFSHYFELNNFFASNTPTSTGDTVEGSAINLAVERRLLNNPNQITTGNTTQTRAPTDPTLPPFYTYERNVGANNIAQNIANLGDVAVFFDAAGGLGSSSVDLATYAGEFLGFSAADAATMSSQLESVQIVMEGFQERASATSGVNVDEELGNLVLYQNAYSASARIITVVGLLFDALIQSV